MEIFKLENVTKIYKVKKKEIVAIKDINLSISDGDIFGVIGLSGAGKSTLIRCLNFLEKPTSGSVYFKGTNLNDLSSKELREVRQDIGMIFQNFNLMEQKTVLKNVMFPLEIAHVDRDERIKRATELLELVGLSDKANVYPSQLSGGQKQRVAIARALANNPSVLLCDEATSALDPNTTNQILKLLSDINKNLKITIVIITHEMRVVESICNKVAIIDESVIKECGDVKDVFINPQAEITRNLIYPELDIIYKETGRMCLRLIFDGNALEPVVANMILKTKSLINILNANIKTEDASIFGEMTIALPNDDASFGKVINYLKNENIKYEIVE